MGTHTHGAYIALFRRYPTRVPIMCVCVCVCSHAIRILHSQQFITRIITRSVYAFYLFVFFAVVVVVVIIVVLFNFHYFFSPIRNVPVVHG